MLGQTSLCEIGVPWREQQCLQSSSEQAILGVLSLESCKDFSFLRFQLVFYVAVFIKSVACSCKIGD